MKKNAKKKSHTHVLAVSRVAGTGKSLGAPEREKKEWKLWTAKSKPSRV